MPGHGPRGDGGDAHHLPVAEAAQVEGVGMVVTGVDQLLHLLVGAQQGPAQFADLGGLDGPDFELGHGPSAPQPIGPGRRRAAPRPKPSRRPTRRVPWPRMPVPPHSPDRHRLHLGLRPHPDRRQPAGRRCSPSTGWTASAFWAEVEALPAFHRERGEIVSRDTAYLLHLLSYVEAGVFPGLDNARLRQLGGRLRPSPGIPEFLDATRRRPPPTRRAPLWDHRGALRHLHGPPPHDRRQPHRPLTSTASGPTPSWSTPPRRATWGAAPSRRERGASSGRDT